MIKTIMIVDDEMYREGMRTLLLEAAYRNEIPIGEVGFDSNHVHFMADICLYSKPEVAKLLRGYTGKKFFDFFPELKLPEHLGGKFWNSGLWNPSYYIGSPKNFKNTINYIKNQKYGEKRRFNLKHPKKSNRLPIVLNKDEILKMIASLSNQKHKLLIELMYGSGLRVGEAIKIRIEDFDIPNKILIIRKGKGDKDIVVNLSERFISNFQYFTRDKKTGYLFESEHNLGKHIIERTAQQIVKNALKKSKIYKKAHPHTFRTSFATHLIENGIDISYVQKLLGHSRLSTTQAYIRLSQNSIRNIKSPLD